MRQTISADRGCVACMIGDDGRPLFAAANDWTGTTAGDGVVLTARVEVPRAGRP